MLNNYVIIPEWLINMTTSHSIPIGVVLDQRELQSMLPKEKLYQYIYHNTSQAERTIGNTNSQAIISGIKNMADNYIRRNFDYDDSLVTYHNSTELKNSNPDDPPLIENLSLKPLVINKDTFGLVITKSTNLPNTRLRRDIYHTLNNFMSVSDIVCSPVFGI